MIIATRGQFPNYDFSSTGTNISVISRTAHKSLLNCAVNNLQLVFANTIIRDTADSVHIIAETANTNDLTFRASIEYPSGTFTPVYFDGKRDVVINGGGQALCDVSAIKIPANTQFWVRTQAKGSSTSDKWPLGSASISSIGESATYQITYSDLTTSTTLTPNAQRKLGPVAIIGDSEEATDSVIIIGDSIADLGADTGDSDGNTGWLSRAISNKLGYTKLARDSDAAGFYTLANQIKRLSAIAGNCTHAYIALGTNDLLQSLSDPRVPLAALGASLLAQGIIPILCTVPPISSSTDSWATVANQTAGANEATRISINTYIRTDPFGYGYVDVADIMESSHNSGKWSVSGGAWTADGIHPNSTVSATIASGVRLSGGNILSGLRTGDANNIIADNTSTQKVIISKTGTLIGTRKQINFIQGTDITLTCADNAGTDSVDITVTSTASGGGSTPAGGILQTLSTTKTDTFSSGAAGQAVFVDVTGLSESITPASSSNKVLITVNMMVATPPSDVALVRLMRGSTPINIGTSVGSRSPVSGACYSQFGNTEANCISFSFLDSPATTAATTYKVQIAANSTGNVYVNRTAGDTNSIDSGRGASTITVQEIKG